MYVCVCESQGLGFVIRKVYEENIINLYYIQYIYGMYEGLRLRQIICYKEYYSSIKEVLWLYYSSFIRSVTVTENNWNKNKQYINTFRTIIIKFDSMQCFDAEIAR